MQERDQSLYFQSAFTGFFMLVLPVTAGELFLPYA
jgi:hypothetical protein